MSDKRTKSKGIHIHVLIKLNDGDGQIAIAKTKDQDTKTGKCKKGCKGETPLKEGTKETSFVPETRTIPQKPVNPPHFHWPTAPLTKRAEDRSRILNLGRGGVTYA
jgi:hypothetical protein